LNPGKFFDPIKRRHHLVVLPRTSVGLERLFGLVSRGYSEGFYRFPRVDYKMIKEASKGGHLMLSTACLGGPLSYEVFKHLQGIEFDNLSPSLLDDQSIMEKVMLGIGNSYGQLVDSVGDATFLELQFNRLPAQHLVNRALIEFANRNSLQDRLIVTCDSHYSSPDHWKERELYKKLGWLNYKDIGPDSLPNAKEDLKCELYPKNAEQVWDSFLETTKDFDFYNEEDVCNAIERTHDIAFEMIGDIDPDCSMKLPSYTIPEGKTADQALIEAAKIGIVQKGLHKKPEYLSRLKEELKIIADKKFSEYFLTTKAIIDLAKTQMRVGPGRGSGAGSLVNYVLGITKAYTTRVGSGPFPTELNDEVGETLGRRGKEFGTVTARKRRCGWFDGVLVRQTIKISGINGIALTKLDVLDELDEIKMCVGYELNEKKIDYLPAASEDQFNIKPIYKTFPGWKSKTQGIRNLKDLPDGAKRYIHALEDFIGARISSISTSPEREDTILVEDPFNN